MGPKLDMTRGGNGQSYMPPKLDLTKSQALPPNAKSNQPSLLRSNYDISMASKQINFPSMSGKERLEQSQWVQSQLHGELGEGCKEGYAWEERPGGWQCKGGAHAVTNELLKEGKGGIYVLPDKKWGSPLAKGPYYKKENGDWVRNTENDPPKS